MCSVPLFAIIMELYSCSRDKRKTVARKGVSENELSSGSADMTRWLDLHSSGQSSQACLHIRVFLKWKSRVFESNPQRSKFNWFGQHWNHWDFYNPPDLHVAKVGHHFRESHILSTLLHSCWWVLTSLQLCMDLLFNIWPRSSGMRLFVLEPLLPMLKCRPGSAPCRCTAPSNCGSR